MKVAVHGYHAGKAWLCICDGVEPPFSKSWIRHWAGKVLRVTILAYWKYGILDNLEDVR